jgi:hypothetical protein
MKNYPYKLDEASLSRAYQHVVEKKTPSWGMMTAYRYANTKKENDAKNKEMEKDLRKLGYGFFKVEGHWQECQDANLNYVDCPKEQLQDSIEQSLFVPGITKEHSLQLCKKYEQDAVVYGGKDTKGNANLLFKNGSTQDIGEFRTGKVEQAFSKIKGNKTFVFKQREKGEKKPVHGKGSFKKFNKKANSNDTKLKNLLPKGLDNKTIKNPDTGRTIKVKSALAYDKSSSAHKAAIALIKKSK